MCSHSGKVRLLFYSGLNKLDEAHSHYKGSICFTQSTDSNFNLVQKHTQRNTQNNTGSNILAPNGPVKLMKKINHHTMILLFKSFTFFSHPHSHYHCLSSGPTISYWFPAQGCKPAPPILQFREHQVHCGYNYFQKVVFIISFLFYSLTHNGILHQIYSILFLIIYCSI